MNLRELIKKWLRIEPDIELVFPIEWIEPVISKRFTDTSPSDTWLRPRNSQERKQLGAIKELEKLREEIKKRETERQKLEEENAKKQFLRVCRWTDKEWKKRAPKGSVRTDPRISIHDIMDQYFDNLNKKHEPKRNKRSAQKNSRKTPSQSKRRKRK